MKEHRGHHREVGRRPARADRRHRLLGEHHRLDGEQVDPALGEGLRLLAKGRHVLLVGGVTEGLVLGGEAAGRADGAGHVAPRGGGGAGEPRPLLVELAGPVAQPVLVELEAGPPEGVGLDEIGAGVEVTLVDPPDHVGVGVVPELGAGAVQEPGREEHGPVAAVEDEALPRPHALKPLAALRQ